MEYILHIVAIVVCYFTGSYIGKFINHATQDIEKVSPEGISEEEWKTFVEPEGRDESGRWIGTLERVLAYFSIFLGAYVVLGGWLVFKVGSKWQTWTNVIKIPETLNNCENDFSYLRARQRWGSWLYMRFIIGTITNVLVGVILALISKAIVSQ